ncbi:uncharacterized protein LOC109826863 [Asparagus officinalis]|uniref:uncharacterized protein LOC109826863 n=1 Tax=Asparagus officinalis TaxID=4686 RepID=UPI00098E33D9|nr:uncharacterized protein LOC109826863 [Asparagus officinalis]
MASNAPSTGQNEMRIDLIRSFSSIHCVMELEDNYEHFDLPKALEYRFRLPLHPFNHQASEALGFDKLSWWKANFGKYPILAKVSRDVLGIPVSTVASKSVFSTGGRVIHCYRSRMTTDMVEALICVQDWIKVEQGVTQVVTRKDDVLDVSKIVDDDDSEIAETFVRAPLCDIIKVYYSDDEI